MVDAVVAKLSFDSGASAWDRFSTRFSALYVPALLAVARIKEGQRVLDVATGTGASAVEAAVVVGQSGLVVATDVSLPMLQKAKPNVEHLPVSLITMDGQALACGDSTFDAVICHLGLIFFPDVSRGLEEFRRVLRPGACMAVSVTTTPERSVYGRVFVAARRFLPAGRDVMTWNFALSDPRALETSISGAGFREVSVTRELRGIPFESRQDYWSTMEAGGGLSGATYVALSPEERRVVRDEVERVLLASRSDGPFAVESEVLIGCGRR
ncbi:MAG TPA: methyltransferase domain-containing protein [Candidatus Binatia bacterium]|nr:methyltransferase domain-containing protein [Candidatus Binatia bacterium]